MAIRIKARQLGRTSKKPRSRQSQTELKTFAEENAERSGRGRESQTITTLSVKSETSTELVI
jgi:hypothetical protein